MTDVTAGSVWQVNIAQLKQANATMRLASQALASDDVAVLSTLGFSLAHIRELRRKGGFRTSSIAQNTRMINCLLQRESAHKASLGIRQGDRPMTRSTRDSDAISSTKLIIEIFSEASTVTFKKHRNTTPYEAGRFCDGVSILKCAPLPLVTVRASLG